MFSIWDRVQYSVRRRWCVERREGPDEGAGVGIRVGVVGNGVMGSAVARRLSLNTVDVVESVLLGQDGLAQDRPAQDNSPPRLLVADMSSIEPAATRRLAAAERGIAWVDAPLSGGAAARPLGGSP